MCWDGVAVAGLTPEERRASRCKTVGYVRPGATAAPGLTESQDVNLLGPYGIAALEEFQTGAPESSVAIGRKRAVARALASKPAALLMDDPTRGLSATEAEAFATVLLRVVEQRGTALVVASQHPTMIGGVHRVVRLVRGRIS